MLFAGDDLVNMIDIALVETRLTLESATITDPEDKPLIAAGLSFEQFRAGMTAIWGHDAALFWAIHEAVREANPRWSPQGNE